jgi:endonuclease YncB( thermonuclease family)
MTLRHPRRATACARIVIAWLAALSGVSTSAAQGWIGPAYVTRVAEGDLIYAQIGTRIEAVRYLGINVPIVDHPAQGREPFVSVARQANQRLVEGKWIYLILGTPPRGRSSRLMAYVWVGNVFVNATLLQRGYVEAASSTDHQYLAYFRTLEEDARRDGRGLWGDRDVLTYYRPHPPEVDPDPGDYRGHPPDGSGGRVFSGTLPHIEPLPLGTRSNPAASSPTVSPGATPDQRRSGPGTYPTLPWKDFPEPGTTYFPVPGGQR